MRRRDLVGADLAIRGIPQRDAGRALFSTEVVTLRIIIAWTSNTECGKAGLLSECTSLTQATWDLMYAHASAAVEVTNTAFALSGVYIQLELAYAFRVNRNDYTEQTTNAFSHAMNALRGTTDGYMDYVHAERERYQAHFVSILVEAPGQCKSPKRALLVYSQCALLTAYHVSPLSFRQVELHLWGPPSTRCFRSFGGAVPLPTCRFHTKVSSF
jgi:hypothetical protein